MARVDVEYRMRMEEVASLTLIAPTDQAPTLQALLEAMETWMEANPHLRGAKLDAKGDFLRLERAYTWEDIVLEPATRAAVERHIVQFFLRLPRYRAFGVSTKRGVLLVGPPGTGKTLLGKVLCSLLPTTFLWVSPGEVAGPRDIQRLFALARECQPTILFLEDLDLYASRRGNRDGEALLGELLNQLDGFPDNSGVLTVATTNDPRAIEPALAQRPSRFDQMIRLDPPKAPGRAQLLGRFLTCVPHSVAAIAETVATTDGLTGAYLREIVTLAIQRALDGQATDEAAPPTVTVEGLREAVRLVRNSRGDTVGHYA
jgi:ATP-dependent 26S proteasome regulatory subunit